MSESIAPFDRILLALRRRKALENRKEGADFLLKIAVDDLHDRLSIVNRRFERALDLTGHTGQVSQMIRRSKKADEIVRADLQVPDLKSGPPDLVLDEEFLPFGPATFDLIIASMTMQWTNDFPGSLVQIQRSLKPDGLFLGNLLGGDSLKELRESFLMAETEMFGGASPRIAPFTDTQAVGGLLQRAGFNLPVVDRDELTIRYDDAFHLMKDLKSMGATNILNERSRKPCTRTLLNKVANHYKNKFADKDGRIRATFQIISLSGWAPHSSQQKPLKPGTAKVSLASVLPPSPSSQGN